MIQRRLRKLMMKKKISVADPSGDCQSISMYQTAKTGQESPPLQAQTPIYKWLHFRTIGVLEAKRNV